MTRVNGKTYAILTTKAGLPLPTRDGSGFRHHKAAVCSNGIACPNTAAAVKRNVLVARVRRDNWNKEHHHNNSDDGNHVPIVKEHLNQIEQTRGAEPLEILKNLSHSLSIAPKVFENQLVPLDEYPVVQLRNGVLLPALSKEPKNLKYLQARLKSARDVSDWTTNEWQSYMMHSYLGTTKEAILFEMMPLFQEFPNQPEYIRTFCQRFNDFPEYAPFIQGIETPCPGFAQGFRFEAYEGVDIEYLCAAVCFSHDHASLILPQIAGEFTYGDVKPLEATSARHGAALVYMRNIALTHAKKRDLDDVAEIITFITNGMSIHFFAHYASTSPEGQVEYHQYPILSANLIGSYPEFLQGITMLRNCQDHALLVAARLRNILEKYHAKNGINAWAYHLNDGEHILSDSEDSRPEDRGSNNDKVESENQDANDPTDHRNPNVARKSLSIDGESSGDEDRDSTDYEDDSPSPTPRQVQDAMQLRPKRRAAQVEEKTWSSPQKRKAGKAPDEKSPRKRRRCIV
ncbi:hypothetical protein V8C37DRAFT_398826 [Trichoderma ceciliae]